MLSYTDQSIPYASSRGVSRHFPDTISFQQTGGERPGFSTSYSVGMVEKGNYMGQTATVYAPPQGPVSRYPEVQPSAYQGFSQCNSNFCEPYEDVCSDNSWGQGWTVSTDCTMSYPDVMAEPGLGQSQQFTTKLETSYRLSQGQPHPDVAPSYYQIPHRQPEEGLIPNVFQQGQSHLGFARSQFQQGHPQQGFAPSTLQQSQTPKLQIRPEWLPKWLYFSPSEMTWAEFYRKFDNYAKDKYWSSQECKLNLMCVLSGKAAEFFGMLNEQAPDLPYYDLIIRLERFMEAQEHSQEHSEQVSKSQSNYSQQILADRPSMLECGNTYNICDENQVLSAPVLQESQQYTPFREPRHQQQERYISYRGPQSRIQLPFDASSTSFSDVYISEEERSRLHGEPCLEERMVLHETTLQSPSRKNERYVTFRGPKITEKSIEDATTSPSNTVRKGKEMETKLEQSFSRVQDKLDCLVNLLSKSNNLLYEKESPSERQTDTKVKICLKDAGVQGLSKKVCPDKKQITYMDQKKEGLEREDLESQVLDVSPWCTPEEDMNQQWFGLDCTNSERSQPRLEEKQIEERVIDLDSMESYEDFIDSVYTKTFGTSSPKVEVIGTTQEYEEWIDGIYGRSFGSSTPKAGSLCSAREYEDSIDQKCKEIENDSSFLTYTDVSKENISGQEPLEICFVENQGSSEITHVNKNQDKTQGSQGQADICFKEDKSGVGFQENQGNLEITRMKENQDKTVIKDICFQDNQSKADICFKTDKAEVGFQENQGNAEITRVKENQGKSVNKDTCFQDYQGTPEITRVKPDITNTQENQGKLEITCVKINKEIQGQEFEGNSDITHCQEFQGNSDITQAQGQEFQDNLDITQAQEFQGTDIHCQEFQGNSDITRFQEFQGKSDITHTLENQGKSDITHTEASQGKSDNTNSREFQSKTDITRTLENQDNIYHSSTVSNTLEKQSSNIVEDKVKNYIWEDTTICQLHSSMLRVPVYLQDHSIKAVVDTAAAVTIISDKIYREMKPKPPCLKKIPLHTAGRDLKMSGFVAGPVSLKLGLSTFSEVVYVAPIQDDILLGSDFLLKHGVSIKLGELQLQVSASDEVAIEVISSNIEEVTVAKVTGDRDMQVSSSSTVRLESNRSQELTGNTVPGDKSRTWLAVLISEHDQLVAKDVPICKVLPRFADGSGETIPCTGSVSDVTSVIQDDTQGSMSSGYSCLVVEPEDLPSRCPTGTAILQTSDLLQEETEPNRTEMTLIKASQLSQMGNALELWTESEKMPELPVQVDVHGSFLTWLQLLVKSMTQWPWDPGGSSAEGSLFRELPGDTMCYQIRAETFSPHLEGLLKPQIRQVSVDQITTH